MRVLLFVEREGRVVCAGPWFEQPMLYSDMHSGQRKGTRKQWAKRRAASHWWLVECENADAGRNVIAWARVSSSKSAFGRILASGGRP